MATTLKNMVGATNGSLLPQVEADKNNGAKVVNISKNDMISDINSDYNFLANAKKTFPANSPPRPFVPNVTSVPSSPLAQQVIDTSEEEPKAPSLNGSFGDMADAGKDFSAGSSIKHSVPDDTASLVSQPQQARPKPAAVQKTMSEEEIRREKAFLLFQLENKNKDFRYSKAHLSMNNSLSEIKNELELINSKRAMESSMGFWRKGLVLMSEGMVYLNNTFDPFAVEMGDWSKQVAYEVLEDKSYDEMLEELVVKYRSSGVSAPVELRLALALGSSFGFGILAKKREMALLEKIQQMPQTQQHPMMFHQAPMRQGTMHGPSMSADDVVRMMQESAAAESEARSEARSESGEESHAPPPSVVSDDQTVITVPSYPAQPKKRGRKPKAKESETILKI